MSDELDFLDGDLLTQEQVGDLFGVTKSTVRDLMRGHKGKPPLPYVRLGKAPLFSRRQVARWLRDVQEQHNPQMAQIRHARRELGLDT